MKCTFDCVGIDAIATSLPNHFQSLDESFLGIDADSIAKILAITGISQVAMSSEETTASDLCFHAAQCLKDNNPAYLKNIDAVLFVSQSRDYLMPSTASILQYRLGFSDNCLALDIPSGCSGYIHGLFLSSTLISSGAAQRVLLLCGETNTKLINPKDKSVSMIFGDAGSATLISRRVNSHLYFNFKTDGSGYDKIIIPHGGCRHPVNLGSLESKEFENGNYRRSIDMKMDGMSVFDFAMTAVPRLISDSLSDCSLSPNDLDLFAAHQANRLIVNQLAKKCGIDAKKSPFLADKFGNTGPTSIPLLLSEGFSSSSMCLKKVLMCGFGVGLNWGVCLSDLSSTEIFSPKFYN